MAAPAARIQVTGAVELRRALGRMGADLKDMSKVNREAADIVASEARQRAPVRSGDLRRSVRGGATKTRGTVSAGKRGIPYAGVIHFGWPAHNIEPQPFIYDAVDEKRDDVVNLYRRRVDDLVRRVGRETPP